LPAGQDRQTAPKRVILKQAYNLTGLEINIDIVEYREGGQAGHGEHGT